MITRRTITIEDYARIAEFWQKSYKLSDRDDRDRVEALLNKNPGLSVLAEDDYGAIVATAFGVYDGMKVGHIKKLVVAKELRRSGVARQIVQEVVDRIKAEGAHSVEVGCDPELIPFYEKLGFRVMKLAKLRIKF